MRDVSVLWPDVNELTGAVKEKYIDVHGILDRCITRTTAALNRGVRPKNILLNSKHGLGKTLMAANVVEELRASLKMQIPLIVFDCSEDTKEHNMKGTFTLQPDGSTMFVPGPIPLVIEMANRTGLAVLCLEEMSALTPGAQKIVNSITDWRSGVYMQQLGKVIRLRPGAQLIVMGTMNPSVYGGVYTLNSDLRSRFVEEVVPWPTMDQERKILRATCPSALSDVIDRAVQLGKDTRSSATEYNLSTRDLVTLVDEITDMPKHLDKVLLCVANKFEGSDRDLVADRIDAIFSTKVKELLAA